MDAQISCFAKAGLVMREISCQETGNCHILFPVEGNWIAAFMLNHFSQDSARQIHLSLKGQTNATIYTWRNEVAVKIKRKATINNKSH